MRPEPLVIFGLLALLPALAGCDRQKAEAPQGEPPAADPAAAADPYPTGRLDRSYAGTPAPGTIFEDPHGRPARVADFRGEPLLVNLWATWCGPCVVEMPSLDALARRDGVHVLALSQDMGPDARRKVTDFFAQRDLARLEPYLDSDLEFMTQLGIETLPTTILYDSEGVEVWRMTGMADWDSDRATRLLTEAAAAPPS